MMPSRMPLTARREPDRIVAWRPDGPITQSRFLADVAKLSTCLPAGNNVLNICQDRYRFLVGFAACLVTGKVSLLPPSQTPEAVRQLKEYAADLFCLHDGNGDAFDLPKLAYPELAPGVVTEVPEIDEDRIAAVLFTSGSTGMPTAHIKRWGALARSSQAEAERLGANAPGYSIIVTVPVQHSYGFESGVMLTLQSSGALWSGWPFYPADIATALAAAPRPRLLVTTPFHLRTLLDSGVDVPVLDRVLSATAPLSEALAREAETRLGAPVYEIYGCTETGQLASRRTTDGPPWLALPGITLEQQDTVTFALGGNCGERQALGDVIQLHDNGTFTLHGRNADMVNIAGKRTSLAYLNHQLNAIPGVRDGCFLMPDDAAPDGITRLCAFVVAPTLSPQQLREALRARIDPLFLPRPMQFLDQLPRNATGKLPRGELLALLEKHGHKTP